MIILPKGKPMDRAIRAETMLPMLPQGTARSTCDKILDEMWDFLVHMDQRLDVMACFRIAWSPAMKDQMKEVDLVPEGYLALFY